MKASYSEVTKELEKIAPRNGVSGSIPLKDEVENFQEIKEVKQGRSLSMIFMSNHLYRVVLNEDPQMNKAVIKWTFKELNDAHIYASQCLNTINRFRMKHNDSLFAIKEGLMNASPEVKSSFNKVLTFFAEEESTEGIDSEEGIRTFAKEYMESIFGEKYDETRALAMADGLLEKYPDEFAKIAGIIKNSVRG